MELRRIGKIDVHARVNGNDSLRTGFVFYSYARGSSALEFHFKDQLSELEPTKTRRLFSGDALSETTRSLLTMVEPCISTMP